MKLRASYLLLLFTLLFTTLASAQVDRRIGGGQYRRSAPNGKKYDFVEESTEYLAKELKLDDFQKAAVRVVVADEKDAVTALNEDTEMTKDEKREKVSAMSKRMYNKIMPLLTKEQGEKFTKIEESKKF